MTPGPQRYGQVNFSMEGEKGWFQGELLTSSPTQFEPFSDVA